MIYFFGSTSKADKLSHPITISTTSGEKKAYALATINFIKNGLKGSPKMIKI